MAVLQSLNPPVSIAGDLLNFDLLVLELASQLAVDLKICKVESRTSVIEK